MNTFEMTVVDAAGFNLAADPLPEGVVGQGYDHTLTTTGGLGPFEWVIAEGRLPEGLLGQALDTGEFRIVGAPIEPGTANLLIVVTDSQGRQAIRAYALRVTEPVIISTDTSDNSGCD